MSNAIQLPPPGIYRDVPFSAYIAWPAISNTRISLARRSLLHFREQVETETTKSLRLGQFVHCGVLEPLAIAMRYAVMPAYELDPLNVTSDGKASQSKATKFYKEKAAAFLTANAGKDIVEQAAYNTLIGISKSLQRSKRAVEYLGERGDAELSIVWQDDETGLPCKARIDLANSGLNDLKSCADAVKFPRSIANYGYHRQAAHYQAGYAKVTDGELRPFRIIAVETTPPHGTRAAPLNEDAIETGRSEVRQTLRTIADAYKLNEWPGYEDPSSWCLPSYYASGDDEIELVVNGETISV